MNTMYRAWDGSGDDSGNYHRVTGTVAEMVIQARQHMAWSKTPRIQRYELGCDGWYLAEEDEITRAVNAACEVLPVATIDVALARWRPEHIEDRRILALRPAADDERAGYQVILYHPDRPDEVEHPFEGRIYRDLEEALGAIRISYDGEVWGFRWINGREDQK